MTATVTDPIPAPDAAVTPGTQPRRPASRAAATRHPRLVPVPESEPPLDAEFDFPAAERSISAAQSTGWPAGTDPSVGPDAAAVRRPAGRPDPTGPDRAAPVPRPPARRSAPIRRGAPPVRGLIPPPRTCPPRPHRAPWRVRVISADSVPGWSNDADMGVRMTSTTALPPAAAAGTALARALLEVLTGCRPAGQLRMHCAPDVFAGLQDAPMLGERGSTRLLATQVCEPADGVAELSVVFRCADHVRAMALRLQGVDGRWRVTALQLG